MNPLEPLPSHLSPVLRSCGGRASAPPPPTPVRSPAADRGTPHSAASGRQPAGALGGTTSKPLLPVPLQASFHFEELAHQVVVKLIRPETNEVVRQIPPEKILRLIVYLRQRAGTSLDKRA